MGKWIAFFLTFFLVSGIVFAQNNLIISSDDLRLTYEDGADFENAVGYHLYIRKKDGIESVMLVETTKDPEGKIENFAFRAREYNPINGDEIRYLNGKKLDSPTARYSLIDSTAESDEQFGEAFHIYIPSEIEFGYPWTRNGQVRIDRGTMINIRTFEKPYGDYDGEFADNPYMFDLAPKPEKPKEVELEEDEPPEEDDEPEAPSEPEEMPEEPEEEEPESEPEEEEPAPAPDAYNRNAALAFEDIAGFSGGQMVYSDLDKLVDDIMDALERIDPKERVDVVFAIDTTGSMKDDVQKLRESWLPRLEAVLENYGDLRIGLLLYRDYGDTYKYMGLPVKFYDFTTELTKFNSNLNNFIIKGKEGGDIPEAVYEALWASMEFYKWREDATRKIILIGDAEPHPKPRGSGKYSKELVVQTVAEKQIPIDTIIVPDGKGKHSK